MQEPTFWEQVGAAILAAVAWLSGEAGRVYVAGAAGGLVRWFQSERRRLLDGVVAVVGGSLSAKFLSPVVAAALNLIGLGLGDGDGSKATLGFLAGLFGMSLTRAIIVLVESEIEMRRRRVERQGRDDDE